MKPSTRSQYFRYLEQNYKISFVEVIDICNLTNPFKLPEQQIVDNSINIDYSTRLYAYLPADL